MIFITIFLIVILNIIASEKLLKSQCPTGDKRTFIYNETSKDRYVNSIPPVVYLKTHKTGSQTLENILFRLADIRDLNVMVPKDLISFNWPKQFPGETLIQYDLHSVDMIVQHSVYNKPIMDLFMKASPYYVTTIREPYSHFISAYNYFSEFTIDKGMNYAQHIDAMKKITDMTAQHARFKNSQAFDLGWYARWDDKTDHDHFNTEIISYIEYLEKTINLIIPLDDYDKGLVLLSYHLNIDINEMVYIRINEDTNKVYPENDYKDAVYEINNVDAAIYKYFYNKFQSVWEESCSEVAHQRKNNKAIMSLEDRLTYLQAANKDMAVKCYGSAESTSTEILRACPEAYYLSGRSYSWFLVKRHERGCK